MTHSLGKQGVVGAAPDRAEGWLVQLKYVQSLYSKNDLVGQLDVIV